MVKLFYRTVACRIFNKHMNSNLCRQYEVTEKKRKQKTHPPLTSDGGVGAARVIESRVYGNREGPDHGDYHPDENHHVLEDCLDHCRIEVAGE